MAREDSRRPASNNQAQEKPRIDPALMEQWLKNQGAEIQNQAREFDLREKEIDANTALAKQQMALHAEIIKIRPEQQNKQFQSLSIVVIAIILILSTFLGWCLHTGNQEFANNLLKVVVVIVLNAFSYWAGKKSKGSNKEEKSVQNSNEQV